MKKIIISFIAGIVTTIILQYAWHYWQYARFKDDFMIFEIGKASVERSLAGSKVLDVEGLPDYKENVNYVYDKLYGVKVRYERNGIVKEITFSIGKYKGSWITPNNTQLYVLDDKAQAIYKSMKQSPDVK
jgi:hypothetical protein